MAEFELQPNAVRGMIWPSERRFDLDRLTKGEIILIAAISSIAAILFTFGIRFLSLFLDAIR